MINTQTSFQRSVNYPTRQIICQERLGLEIDVVAARQNFVAGREERRTN